MAGKNNAPKLNERATEQIIGAKAGLAAFIVRDFVLFAKFPASLNSNVRPPSRKNENFVFQALWLIILLCCCHATN